MAASKETADSYAAFIRARLDDERDNSGGVCLRSLIMWAVTRIGQFVVNDAARLQALYGSISSWLQGHGIEISGWWANYLSADQLFRLVQRTTAYLNKAVSFLIVAFIYVLLGLLEVDDVALKLEAWPHGRLGQILLAGGGKTAGQASALHVRQNADECSYGLLVCLFAWLIGLPLALEWGTIAFVLNFIPFIGPFIATVFPSLFAAASVRLVADGRHHLPVSQRYSIRCRQLS